MTEILYDVHINEFYELQREREKRGREYEQEMVKEDEVNKR